MRVSWTPHLRRAHRHRAIGAISSRSDRSKGRSDREPSGVRHLRRTLPAEVGETRTFRVVRLSKPHHLRSTVDPRGEGSMSTARILIADDDDALRKLLERALARHGFEVTSVCDGNEA